MVTATLPFATEASFTKSYTDAATHNSANCGDVALTEVKFSVLKVPSVSISSQDGRLFQKNLRTGLRQFAPAAPHALSVKSMLRVSP